MQKTKERPTISARLQGHLQSYQRQKPLIAIKEWIMIIVCTFPYGLVVNQLLVPHAIVGGGLTGLCEIIYFATNRFIPIWLSVFTLNAILLIIAGFTIGWRYCARTLFGIFWLTFWMKKIPIPEVPMISDPFMAVIL
ncbi:MAG: YitT family protein, partial [Paludibacteraceae bacterium]